MDQVIKGATAKVRRQIVVHGDRCLEESELPFYFNTNFLSLEARSNPDKCITWGIIDSVLDGIRQCGYEQGNYNLMSCIIIHAWGGDIGFLSLKRSRRATGDKSVVSHG